MKKIGLTLMLLGLTVMLVGCNPKTYNVDTENDTGKAVMALDYRDFEKAAGEVVQSLFQSGILSKDDGSRYVVATGRIVNDTLLHIDTDRLMAKVEEEIMNSGLVVMTSAVGGKGASDEMVFGTRDLADGDRADEFNAETMPGKGQIVLPELSLSGKIGQSNLRYDSRTQQVEYYVQLQLTEIASGLRFWQKEVNLVKRGSKKSTPW